MGTETMTFSLERKYIVIKIEDACRLSDYYYNQLANILAIVEQERSIQGKEPLRGIFISEKWPEYEPTVALLADRVNKEDGTS